MAFADYVAFADDSGNDPKEEWFVLAGWVATIADWENFAEDWINTLKSPPKVDYFKHNAAIARKKAFARLTEADVDRKARSLVKVIQRHNLHGVIASVRHQVHRDVYLKSLALVDAKSAKRFNNVLDLAANHFIPAVLQYHFDNRLKGTVDFIFDDGKKRSPAGDRCVEIFKLIKEAFRQTSNEFYPLMGRVDTGTDEEYKPLQAADFLAGQVRLSLMNNERMFPPLADMVDNKRMDHVEISEEWLRASYPRLFLEEGH